ncbi:MAG TPA: beta-glucosidase [Bacteroidetes bacterium]|nr:beta-glucosidase [Bacteroidota bacterium]
MKNYQNLMLKELSQWLVLAAISFLISCQNEKSITPAYQDPGLPVEQRVSDLLSRMSLEEKIGQMCQYVGIEHHMKQAERNMSKEELETSDSHGFYPGLHSSDIAAMIGKGQIGSFLHVFTAEEANRLQEMALNSRLKIPLLIGIDAIHGNAMVPGATVYPTPIGLASTWDTALVKKIFWQTAREVRATGSAWTFAPNVDVARDARWGRVGETFGEDPFLVSEMGRMTIRGLQQKGPGRDIEVLACAKHLIAGSQSVNGINGAPTDLSERTIREIFLPPYQAAIEEGVGSIMTAHNELNGIPCHANEWLMTEVIRNEMGFDGFFISDWMDIGRLETRHHIAGSMEEASGLSVEAGMDMDMHGPGFMESLISLVEKGVISESRIDQSVRRILAAKFRLGLFEQPFTDSALSDSVLFTAEHVETALEAALKSIILLRNEKNLLPLSRGKYSRILVTGPNADNQSLTGDWSSRQPEDHIITVLDGLEAADPDCTWDYLNVGSHAAQVTAAHVAEAGKRAQQADLAIVVAGENSSRWEWNEKTCGENAARSGLDLLGLQNDLIRAIWETGTPVIVVLVNGRPLATKWVAEHAQALIEAWEPGCMGGLALAKILFGDTNPSGKLPISIPRSPGHQLTVYNHKPTQYFHSYVDEASTPLFPFGFGLSYTQFVYSGLSLDKNTITPEGSLELSVEISNQGRYAGEEVAQLYIRDQLSSVTRPVKELKAYFRLHLEPGEKKAVRFTITPEMLGFLGKDLQWRVEPGRFTAMVGGSSMDSDLLRAEFSFTEN